MTSKKLRDREPHAAHLTRQVDQVCDRYEAAWKLAVGAGARPPRIEEYLEGTAEPEHSALRRELEELIAAYRPLLRSSRSGTPVSDMPGEAKTDGTYSTGGASRPRLSAPRKAAGDSSDPTATFEIADKPLTDPPGLYEKQKNDRKTHASSERIRCLHCHHPLELIDDGREEVRCPGCGSSFRVCDARETTPLPPSRTLGRFKLLERVGAGAYGEVWRAFDPELDRPVAVKIPHAGLASEPSQLERFYREARAAAQLRHLGIVSVHEVVMVNGLPVIVSDFIDGVPLRHLLAEQRLTFREAAELTAQLADALDYAHSMGLVHRDIKPGNIMVLKSRVVSGGVVSERSPDKSVWPTRHSPLTTHHSPVIMDFGLALREEAEITMTLDGHVVGTPAYMSPEQAIGQGHRADRRSDVYSLGVILYEMLTGELPFRGSKKYMLQQVQSEEPRPPRKINDKIARDLETIVLKAMAKAPARRYATARDLADDLRRFLQGQPILARPVGRTEKVLRWCRRNPAPAIAAAVVLAAILAVTVSVSVAAVESRATKRISAEKQETEAQRNRAEENHRQAQRLSTELLLHRGRTLGEQGEIGQGMLWLARGLSADPNANPDFQRVLRMNLSAFERRLNSLREILPHSSSVRVVAFSPDGKFLATGCADGTVRLGDALTGQPKGVLRQHQAAVRALAFSPDGHELLSGSDDKTAQLWNLSTGKPEGLPFIHGDKVLAVAFTSEANTILTATGKGAFQWDRGTRKSRDFNFPAKKPARMVAFSPDGKRVLESESGSTRLWDLSAASPGKPLFTVQHAALSSIVWNPDGLRFLTGDREGDVRIWSVDGDSPAEPILHLQGAVQALAFSADGKKIATGSEDKTAALWDADTLKPIGQPLVNRGTVLTVAFDSTGRSVVVGGEDSTASVWHVASRGIAGPKLRLPGQIHVLAYSPDGNRLLLGGFGGSARIWDAHTGKVVADLRSDLSVIGSAVFGPNGKTTVTAGPGKNAYVWDAESGKLLHALKHQALNADVNHVNFSPDGKIITTAGDENVCLWDAATGNMLGKPLPHAGAAYQAIFSPDGSLLLTAGHDNKAYLWETGTGRLLREFVGHQGAVYTVAFSSDGKRILTGSSDRTGRLWDTASGRQIGPVLPHEDEVRIVAFSPDDRTLLTGSYDNSVRLWDAATGQPKGPVLQHQSKIFSATFSQDGKLVLTGSNDRTARLWDTTTGEAIGPVFRHQEGVTCVAFNPDGQSFVTASNDKTVQTWEVPVAREGEVERLVHWTQVITGIELAPDTGLRVIDASDWRQLRQKLGIRRSGE